METETTLSYVSPIFFVPLASLAIILLALHIFIENSRSVRIAKNLPGPPRLPIIGNLMLVYGVSPANLLRRLLDHDIYGTTVRAILGNVAIIFVAHPRDIELILSSSVHLEKAYEYRFFKAWLGDGLLISKGDKWRTHRKIIAPTFHMSILKTFVPLFYENSRDLVKRLRSQIGKEFDCHDYLSATTVDILTETAMGVRGAEKEKTSFDYAMAVMKMCDITHQRQYNIFLRSDHLYRFSSMAKKQKEYLDTIHGLTSGVIRTKKEETYSKICNSIVEKENKKNPELTEIVADESKQKAASLRYVRDDLDELDDDNVGEKKRLAFLDLLLELARQGIELSEEDIKEEVNTIMFEGHDTTAAGSSFVLCALGVHQDIQARVYEELRQIFGNSNRQCTYQDTLEMKYLERVILETLRIFPPVPAIARKLNQDVKLATRDDVLPKNTTIVIPIFKVHRLEEFYPNPDVFDPDRFLPEQMQERHYYSFIPFSAGPRSCVGRKYAMLKLKVLISTILRNYKVTSDLTEKDFQLQVDIILKRSDGFRIKIEPRNTA